MRISKITNNFAEGLFKLAKKDAPMVTDKTLEKDRKDKDQVPFDRTTEGVLGVDDRGNRKDDKDVPQQLIEKNLREHKPVNATNAGLQGTTEARLDKSSKEPYPHRNEEAYRRTGEKRPINALPEEMGENSDEAKRRRYEAASKKAQDDKKKRILDKDPGSQLTLDHPKKAFNMRDERLSKVAGACSDYLAYKGSRPGGWDRFPKVRSLDAQVEGILLASQEEKRVLTAEEQKRIAEFKAQKNQLLGIKMAGDIASLPFESGSPLDPSPTLDESLPFGSELLKTKTEMKPLTPQEIDAEKAKIDEMSQRDMAYLLRFAPAGHPYFDSANAGLHDYFMGSFKAKGGMTPEISKAISWEEKPAAKKKTHEEANWAQEVHP